MAKPALLLWTESAERLLDGALADRFDLIRLWEAHDPEATIDARGKEVIAVLTTRCASDGDRPCPTPARSLNGHDCGNPEEPRLIRATAVLPRGHWSDGQGEIAPADTVVLDFDDRHRRRIAMTGTRGLEFLLDLPETTALRGGDALVLEDGRLVEVVAVAEPLIEVRGRTPRDLARLAWHIGNRHLAAQVTANALRIRGDHVIADMLRGLGASVTEIEAPFDPEGGAYAGGAHDSVELYENGDRAHHHGHEHHAVHEHDHGGKHGHEHKHDHRGFPGE